MKTASAKNKGRRLQQYVRDLIKAKFGLSEDDVRSTSMGAGGTDILLSSWGKELFPFSVECKNQESINIWSAWEQANANRDNNTEALLVAKRNGQEPFVVVDLQVFMNMAKKYSEGRK